MTWKFVNCVSPGLTTWTMAGGDGKLVVRRNQDCGAIIEHNKRLATADRKSTALGRGGVVASIPMIILERWGHEIGRPIMSMPAEERRAFIYRKLRDPEWQYLLAANRRV